MSHTLWQHWTTTIAARLSEALEETVDASEIVVPPDTKLGDFAFPCFAYAKARGVSSAELAKQLVTKLEEVRGNGLSFSAAGPYVNVLLEVDQVIQDTLQEVAKQGEAFGTRPPSVEKAVLIEYANPNTHKEIHLGHLRNFLTGRAFVSLLKAAGKPVIPVSFVNDQGANVAKTLWWMLEKEGISPQEFTDEACSALLRSYYEAHKNTGQELGRLYTEATREEESRANAAQHISFIQSSLEAHHPLFERLWKETRDWCLRELQSIFAELKIDLVCPLSREGDAYPFYLESTLIDRAQEVVNELEKKGIAKESQGALIIDLEEEKLGVMLVRKSDGNLLYASKDLALAEQKIADFPDIRAAYSVVDVRQGPYFKQLASVLKKLGHDRPFGALCYELLKLPEGAMSSRKGNVVTYQDLMGSLLIFAAGEIKRRHPEWKQEKINEVAKTLALSGITFGILKQDPDKIYVFDMEQALSFEGATGPYCQYAVTRLQSILRKAEQGVSVEAGEEDERMIQAAQKNVALTIAQLPEKVALAAKDLRPSILAQWCLSMAQAVSAFYRDVPVLSAKDKVKEERLALVKSAHVALTNGLRILGITVPEEM